MLIKLLIILNSVSLMLTIFGKNKKAFNYVPVWRTSLTNCRQCRTRTFLGTG